MVQHKKYSIDHPIFYIVNFKKSETLPYILFIHGGPGLNCGVLEYLIENENIFSTLEYNIILYDQRNCGRSKFFDEFTSHNDNLSDLKEIYKILIKKEKFNIIAFAGHSYGAKLLFDYMKCENIQIPSIFISTSSSILTPRINNILLDLAYLKIENPKNYQIILENFSEFNFEKIWELTESLKDLFQKNKNRILFYWANLEWEEKVKLIQQKINLPMAVETFMSVRKDLYSSIKNASINFDDNISGACHIIINGFHDLIINGASAFINPSPFTKLFLKSAHYPHIEEHLKFCEIVNEFLKKN